MKKKLVITALTLCVASQAIACGHNQSDQDVPSTQEVVVETNELTAISESDLENPPEYGANPSYDVWTTVPYEEVDAGISFVATVSAKEDFSEFEILCNFFDDQQAVVIFDGTNYTVQSDRTGFMTDMGPDLAKLAVENNKWVLTSDCSLEYIDVSAADSLPTYIKAGVWEDDFTRTNENLNGMITDVDDSSFSAYKQESEKKGTIETLTYDTCFYAIGSEEKIQKTAYVYLPADYDSSKQYNVLYLIHGGGDDAQSWFSYYDKEKKELGEGASVNILDNLFASGECASCIIVTPGLYDMEGADQVDQTSTDITTAFAKELNDLITVVESEYSTYANSVTEDGLIASRDHRAMAGYSMGSITTWHSGIAQCLDKISWFGTMSAGPSSDIEEALAYTQETLIPAFNQAAEDGYTMNMLLNFNGTKDMALDPQVATHKALLDYMSTNDYLVTGENYDFVVSNGTHNYIAWELYLYEMMHVFFK